MDTDIQLSLGEPEEELQPQNVEAQLTDEEKLAKDNEQMKKDAERFRAFAPIIEGLEKKPDRIFEVRSALDGTLPQPQQYQPQPQYQAPQPQISTEQLKAMNDNLTKAVLEGNGVQAIAQIASAISQDNMRQFAQSADPVIRRTGETFIESFKNRKSSDKLFSAYEAAFDEELADLDPGQLVNMDSAQRTKELNRRYQAAQGRILSAKVQTPARQQMGTAAAGGAGMGAPSRNESQISDQERNVMRRSGMTDDDIKAFEADLRDGKA